MFEKEEKLVSEKTMELESINLTNEIEPVSITDFDSESIKKSVQKIDDIISNYVANIKEISRKQFFLHFEEQKTKDQVKKVNKMRKENHELYKKLISTINSEEFENFIINELKKSEEIEGKSNV